MDEARRREYLKRMGIPLWLRRETASAPAADAVSAQGARPVPHDDSAASPVVDSPAPERGGEDREGLWQALEAEVAECTACALHATRTQAVCGVGARAASLMIVGEAPGADEDRLGEPFVGRAGRLLDEMLRAIGLARTQVYITNILKCRPPNNRDPQPAEIAACEQFLRRQLALVSPRVILAVGRVSAQYLLDTDQPLGRLRGRWHAYGPAATPLWVTYHPAYLLRRPVEKRKAWADLKRVQARVQGEGE
ncbi:uracil-DNA glycosylase [Arhodomonas sp. SL1]|uniref:uracil-DNA glycosylase n=1 Tax=Arhodomonas sp. SL1 TaxID=3425691 RepID=UPI003F882324